MNLRLLAAAVSCTFALPAFAALKAGDPSMKDGRAGIKDTRGVDIDHGFTERTTFIVTPDGRIAATVGGMSAQASVDKALEAVQSLR